MYLLNYFKAIYAAWGVSGESIQDIKEGLSVMSWGNGRENDPELWRTERKTTLLGLVQSVWGRKAVNSYEGFRENTVVRDDLDSLNTKRWKKHHGIWSVDGNWLQQRVSGIGERRKIKEKQNKVLQIYVGLTMEDEGWLVIILRFLGVTDITIKVISRQKMVA